MDVSQILADNFLGYASHAILHRAIPAIDDGLTPVGRRILHALSEMNLNQFHKVSNVVGSTMKYHPHGDATIEGSLVSMTQKGYLLEGQGNFGNVLTGDSAAAGRYIECKLSGLAKEAFLDSGATLYQDSYDGRNKEPVKLPARIPYLLMAGADGIAVGLATKILPHNFKELLNAQISILKAQDNSDSIDITKIPPLEIYPDFLTGGKINVSDYRKGQGKVRVRATIDIVDKGLIIRDTPYSVTTESLIESIHAAIEKGVLKITTIEDYTTDRVEIRLTPGRGVNPKDLIEKLYLYTDCEITLSSNITVISNGKPTKMTVDEVLIYNTIKLRDILKKSLQSNLKSMESHLRTLLLTHKFIEEKVYKLLESADTLQPVLGEMQKFIPDVTLDEVTSLASMPFKKIMARDLKDLSSDMDRVRSDISRIVKSLSDMNAYTISYIEGLLKKYGSLYTRKTAVDANMTELVASEVAVQDIKVGYDGEYLGTEVKSTKPLLCSKFDKILLFYTSAGQYKVINIPDKTFFKVPFDHYLRVGQKSPVTVVYELEGITYMKRFVISQYILDKVYQFMPEGAKLVLFSLEDPVVQVDYVPGKKRVAPELFDLGRILIKNVKSQGNVLSERPIQSFVQVPRERSSEIPKNKLSVKLTTNHR